MPVQMFVVHPRDGDDDEARGEIAAFIAQRQGFILMATSYGSLIAAFDDVHLDSLKRHPLVDFVGGVTLDPAAPGAAALQRMFAENVAAQLVERGVVGAAGDDAADDDDPLPSRFRRLGWPDLGASRPAAPLFTTDPGTDDD
jgi:hypothetical protein